MALATQTLLSLVQKLAEANSDYISVATTTNIAGSSTVILSTNLNQYDDAEDDYFNDWWCYLNTTANATVLRKVSDYTTSGGSVTLYGANLSAESASRTIYLFRYNRDHYKNAIIEACDESYPSLHKRVDDITLVTGNYIPDAHFESWSSTTALNHFTVPSGSLAQTSTAGSIRGGKYSAQYTAGVAGDILDIDSETYPRLLELQDKTVNFYVQALPQTANDAYIEIYTLKTDGTTAQTLTSTTTNATGVFTKLELESQTLNDDLDYISIRFKVATSGQYVTFDDAYLGDQRLTEYLLPDDFINGHLSQVFIQTSGTSDEPFYDVNPFYKNDGVQIPFDIISDGTNRYLKLLYSYPVERRLRLIGFKPLETLSADTDTITLDNQRVPLLIAKSLEIFYEREIPPVSTEDVKDMYNHYMRAQRKVRSLLKFSMPRPVEMVK